ISTNVKADVVCIEGKGSKQVLNISEPIKVDGLVISVLETLDIALNKYWSVSPDVGLFATILDPRTKKLKKFTEAERQRAIALLIDRYEIYNVNDNNENKSESQNDADLLNNKSIMNMIMEDEESSDEEEENEINIYLKNKANRDILPLSWWENNEKKFTFLSKMAKEYLAIPVTSTDNIILFNASLSSTSRPELVSLHK
ncbi:8282_t:CDS:1, partial [Funneliformis mosseae]